MIKLMATLPIKRGFIKKPATRAHIHKGSFSRIFSKVCAASFASALWRRLLFSLSLALTCTLLWSCALPIHSSASFLSFLLLFICALLGRCSSDFSINPVDGFSDFPGAFDAFVANSGAQNQIYTNNGSGIFTNRPPFTGAPANNSTDAVLGDLDGDGNLDAFVVNSSGHQNQIYINDGNGVFTNRLPFTGAPANNSFKAALGDLDGGGDLDAFVANSGQQNQIYTNDGSGGFTRAAAFTRVALTNLSRGVALGDLDGDGNLDAFVVNSSGHQNQIYINDGNGVFTNRLPFTGAPANNSFKAALGDLDGDRDLDAFVANNGQQKPNLYQQWQRQL